MLIDCRSLPFEIDHSDAPASAADIKALKNFMVYHQETKRICTALLLRGERGSQRKPPSSPDTRKFITAQSAQRPSRSSRVQLINGRRLQPAQIINDKGVNNLEW